MEAVLQVVQRINFYLSDYILVFLLIGTGLYFSVRTRFVQVRCFGEGMRSVFGEFNMRGGRQKGGLSSFQALTTAIAAQVGTGNIIGACGAILLGGPGAIFWMWIIAFFGMATIYAEAVLAQETRRVAEDGSVSGGPVYYIKRAFPGRFGTFLAGFFAVALILALGFMGCMVQSNSIGETCAAAFGVPSWAVGIAVAVLAAVVFLGGIQRIAGVTEKLVPVMAALYLLGGLVVLVCRIRYLPEAVGMIFRYAFVPNAIIGGSLGYALKMAVSQGVKRGLFSNEAGMGSTPHAHAMAKVKRPHEQGVVAMTGVFIDTFVVLTMTALVVISTLYAGNGILSAGAAEGVSKANMAQLAFGTVLGSRAGSMFVAVCLLFFAFSTILSWNFFGRLNVSWLLGEKAVGVYSVLAIGFICIQHPIAVFVAWKLDRLQGKAEGLLRCIYFLPNVISVAVIAYLWKFIYNPNFGLLQKILEFFGYQGNFNALGSGTAIWAVLVVLIWHGFGWGMLIYYTGIKNIDQVVYEAAAIDGATDRQIFFRITLPLMKPVIKYNVTLAIISALKQMETVYLLTNGGPGNETQFLATYLYKQAFGSYKYGYGNAISVVFIIVCLAATLIMNKVFAERKEVA